MVSWTSSDSMKLCTSVPASVRAKFSAACTVAGDCSRCGVCSSAVSVDGRGQGVRLWSRPPPLWRHETDARRGITSHEGTRRATLRAHARAGWSGLGACYLLHYPPRRDGHRHTPLRYMAAAICAKRSMRSSTVGGVCALPVLSAGIGYAVVGEGGARMGQHQQTTPAGKHDQRKQRVLVSTLAQGPLCTCTC